MKRVALITGITGFIGSNLAVRLKNEGWHVVGLVRRKDDAHDHNEIYNVTDDHDGSKLREVFQRVKPNVVFHLASLFLAQHQTTDLVPLLESNILLGTRLLQTVTEFQSTSSQPIDFIAAGTGWQVFSDDDHSPVNLYAATKSAFHSVIDYYSSAHGIRSAELRLFDNYGPHDPRRKVIRILLEASLTQQSSSPLDFSPGDQLLHLIYIDDTVRAFVMAAEWIKDQPSKTCAVFKVDSDQPISLKTLAGEIEHVTGEKLAIRWGGRPYRDREVMNPFSSYRRVPGWGPKVSLREGLRQTAASLTPSKN